MNVNQKNVLGDNNVAKQVNKKGDKESFLSKISWQFIAMPFGIVIIVVATLILKKYFNTAQ